MQWKLLMFFICSMLLQPGVTQADRTNDPVFTVLSARHLVMDISKLEKLAGGEDALVKRLLELRHDTTLPFISVRSEKVLLHYAAREEVRAALEQDLASPETKGLARVIAIHLDRVPDSDVKVGFAKKLIDRGTADKDFLPYARAATSESTDPKLRELGRDALK